jgi:DNA-binding MarR family transcriptional regulator
MTQDSLALILSDSARLLRRRFDARAQSLGVSRAQWQVLGALARMEGTNQSNLADYLEVETITLCRMIDRLQEAGLVERRADPADRRAWRLYLTDVAHPLLDQLRAVAQQVMAEALAGIDADQQASLTAGLAALRANLSRKGADPRTDVLPATQAVA